MKCLLDGEAYAFTKERRLKGKAQVDNKKLLEYFLRGQAIVNDAVEKTRAARQELKHVEWKAPSSTGAKDVIPAPIDTITPLTEATLTEPHANPVIPLKEAILPSQIPRKTRPKE